MYGLCGVEGHVAERDVCVGLCDLGPCLTKRGVCGLCGK